MSSKKKNILNIGFLVLLLVLTFWLVFRDQDLGPILAILGKVPIHFIIIGLILVVCYVCGESVIIKYLLHAVKIKAPLINCIRYSFVGFFFSCITPSATGGQPAQIFYMQRQKIDIPTASIILMLVTIEYKFVLVFIGLALALFGQPLVQTLTSGSTVLSLSRPRIKCFLRRLYEFSCLFTKYGKLSHHKGIFTAAASSYYERQKQSYAALTKFYGNIQKSQYIFEGK